MADTTPFLRTLSPALRGLERGLRSYVDGPHRYPLSALNRAALEGLAGDLKRQADALDVDKPLLVVMLMGGTGVGKSTLLNAMAGGSIAQASFTRPTTRDPVVYYHESVRPERLDPALRYCRLAPHNHLNLEQKIIVDTPDLDSNDLANRDKLALVLPVADIVLYVGSQEKYHDKLGWELFLHQRRRRAFAFVLNKWDRCQHAGAAGLRPDEDLSRDLQAEGFKNPLIFRTCANRWLDRLANARQESNGKAGGAIVHAPPDLPEGEQFADLVNWLEMGLTRLEVEAIKARGVTQMLKHLEEGLAAAAPPDFTEVAKKTRAAWTPILIEEANNMTDVLIDTLDPFQREIEHHFTREGQRRFRGLMAAYLHVFNRMLYFGSTLKERMSFLPQAKDKSDQPPPSWDLNTFTRACTESAAQRHLDARQKALANRLLVEGDQQGFKVDVLTAPVEATTKFDWRQRYTLMLNEVLHNVEQQWTRPKGTRLALQHVIVFFADWLPLIALLAAALNLLWRWIDPSNAQTKVETLDIALLLVVPLVVMIVLHVLITLLLPLRWPKIRSHFRKELAARIQAELDTIYLPVPSDLAEMLLTERRTVDKLVADAHEVGAWLTKREEAAGITGMYGI
jgi:energy-coupling factor transporter ATP-binding protein EcfA2